MKRVLVVDDDSHLRDVIAELLALGGFSVATAPNGPAALEQVQHERFDLVFLDVHMPKMSGLEVLARLRELPDPPRVIMLTADDTPETVLRSVRDQAYRFLPKPFDPGALVAAAKAAVEESAVAVPIEVLSAQPDWVELLVPCDLQVVDRLQEFMERMKSDLPEEVRSSVGQAFRELLMNAIEWGGQLDPSKKVRISYLRANRMLLYRIADPGRGFRFAGLDHAAVSYAPGQPIAHMKPREEKGLRPGGFGLLVAKAMVDELLYNEAQNEVVLIKYLD